MTNQIENENKDGFDEQILIGQVDIPNRRVHIFRSMQAMTDFMNTFKLSSGQWRTGTTSDGVWAVELVYDVAKENM